MLYRLVTEWISVQQSEKCVCAAYVCSPLYLERSGQIVLKMALKLQMVHVGQEEASFSSELIIILWRTASPSSDLSPACILTARQRGNWV